MSISSDTKAIRALSFRAPFEANMHEVGGYLRITIMKCPNDDCRKETVFAEGVKGYMDNTFVHVYPRAVYTKFPDYVPEAIRLDYEEACSVIESSPKAAATLARRCLQGMIRDFWGIRKGSLFDEITELQGRATPAQWKAIDAIRSIGNIGAHMEKDVNLIVDVEADEAVRLVKLIEHLIEKWYVDRHETEELYSDVIAIGDEKKAARKQDAPADQ